VEGPDSVKAEGKGPKLFGMDRKEDEIEGTPIMETQSTLPSTVKSGADSMNNAMMEALNDFEDGQIVPAIEENMIQDRVESTLSYHDRIIQLKTVVSEQRDEMDDLRDLIDIIRSDIREGILGCDRCNKGKPKEVLREARPYILDTTKLLYRMKTMPEGKTMVGNNDKPVQSNEASLATYKKMVNNFVANRGNSSTIDEKPKKVGGMNFAAITKKSNADGFTVVMGKSGKGKPLRKEGITKRDVIPDRERHLKIMFAGQRGVKHILPGKVTVECVRNKLNNTLRNLNIDGYFSRANANRWGDIEMILANTRAADLVRAGNAMTEALGELGIENIDFVQDTKKMKVYVAMVPLKKGGFGKDWEPEGWAGDNAFDSIVADIEKSNP
jgi:hypothetical protein